MEKQYLRGTVTCAPVELDDSEVGVGGEMLAVDFIAVTRQTERSGPNDNGLFIEPAGFDISRFAKNSTLLAFHDQASVPIGKVVELDQSRQRLKGKALIPHFADDYLEDVRNQIERGIMKGISIGFFPTKTEEVFRNEIVEEEDPETGKKRKRREKVFVGTRVLEGRLLEISVVSQGADEDALVTGAESIEVQGADEELPDSQWLMERTEASGEEPVMIRHTLKWGEAVAASLGEHAKVIDRGLVGMPCVVCGSTKNTAHCITCERCTCKTHFGEDGPDNIYCDLCKGDLRRQSPDDWRAIPLARHGAVGLAPEDTPWSGIETRLAASVEELKIMSLFEDDVNGGYKGLHHRPDGTLVLRGVQAAMGVLLGARGGFKGIPAAELQKGYNHLAKELQRFDIDLPEFRQHTHDELTELAKDGIIAIAGKMEIVVAHVGEGDDIPDDPDEIIEGKCAVCGETAGIGACLMCLNDVCEKHGGINGVSCEVCDPSRVSEDFLAQLRAEIGEDEHDESCCPPDEGVADEIAAELAKLSQEQTAVAETPAPQSVPHAAVAKLELELQYERRRRVALQAHTVALLHSLAAAVKQVPREMGKLLSVKRKDNDNAKDHAGTKRNRD